MNDKTFEPVFPTIHNGSTLPGSRGITVRDWFAGMAMQGLLSCDIDCDPEQVPTIAKSCYAMADEMLKAREAK